MKEWTVQQKTGNIRTAPSPLNPIAAASLERSEKIKRIAGQPTIAANAQFSKQNQILFMERNNTAPFSASPVLRYTCGAAATGAIIERPMQQIKTANLPAHSIGQLNPIAAESFERSEHPDNYRERIAGAHNNSSTMLNFQNKEV